MGESEALATREGGISLFLPLSCPNYIRDRKHRINGISDVKYGLACAIFARRSKRTNGKEEGKCRGAGDAGRRDKACSSRNSIQTIFETGSTGLTGFRMVSTGWHAPSSPAVPNARTGHAWGDRETVVADGGG